MTPADAPAAAARLGPTSATSSRRARRARAGIDAVGRAVRRAPAAAARHFPAGVEATSAAALAVAHDLEARSPNQLRLGAGFCLGVATGLLIAGGPRLLVLLAGVPATAMALVLLGRRSPGET